MHPFTGLVSAEWLHVELYIRTFDIWCGTGKNSYLAGCKCQCTSAKQAILNAYPDAFPNAV